MTMQFLDDVPRYVFFTGKGGVGKTSIACATAVYLADAGRRVLLVSTDPASNVGHVFGVPIGNRVTPVPEVPRLSALEIDPEAAAQAYRDRIVGPVRGTLPDDVVKGIEEQLSGACTTEIAAFDEFTALLTDTAIAAEYDHLIFDTAPTGHTIRLLQLPGAWTGFLETGKGDASCLGPLAGLEKQREKYKGAVEALRDGQQTRMVLVTRAQRASLAEVARTHDELSAIGITHHHLVVNGVFPSNAIEGDGLAAAIVSREQAALDAMPIALQTLPRDEVGLKPFNLVGVSTLRALLTDGVSGLPAPSDGTQVSAGASLDALVDDIAAGGHGLVMLMGKGGVGKTTIAAAVATALAQRGLSVHLTTSDPAAHLADTLAGEVEHLRVSRIDPEVETERYRQRILDTKGRDLDAAGRAMLEEDLRSPCTEEIAVFQAFSRIIREARSSFVVMDTAPTGHTLLLLDATGAYHREVTRQMRGGLQVTTPLMQLQDPQQTKVLIVTLAETTPVLEAAGLQADLRRAGIEPWAWVVNQSLAVVPTTSPLLERRGRGRTGAHRRCGHEPRRSLRGRGSPGRRARWRGAAARADARAARRRSCLIEFTSHSNGHSLMRIAIISDIHGNMTALEAVLADLRTRPVDAVYCLGDLVGYAAHPNEVTQRIRAEGIPTLMGNYDDGVGFERDECGCAYTNPVDKELGDRSLVWTKATVTAENKAFLRTLVSEIRFDADGRRVLLVHGSPRRINEYLFEDRPISSFQRLAASSNADIIVFGHTHKPYTKLVDDVLFVNAGSVGKPKDGDWRACYIILDPSDPTSPVEFIRVAYDVAREAAAIRASDLPDKFAMDIETGGVITASPA